MHVMIPGHVTVVALTKGVVDVTIPLFKNDLLKISKATFLVPSKFGHVIYCLYFLIRKFQTSSYHFTKIGDSRITCTLLKHYKMSRMGPTPYQIVSSWETLNITLV